MADYTGGMGWLWLSIVADDTGGMGWLWLSIVADYTGGMGWLWLSIVADDTGGMGWLWMSTVADDTGGMGWLWLSTVADDTGGMGWNFPTKTRTWYMYMKHEFGFVPQWKNLVFMHILMEILHLMNVLSTFLDIEVQENTWLVWKRNERNEMTVE